MKLFAQVNADTDLMHAWLAHYRRLGVREFHLILNGPPEDNEPWRRLTDDDILIEGDFHEPFVEADKVADLNALSAKHRNEWVWVVDSDEFVEVPEEDSKRLLMTMEEVGCRMLRAPMLQRCRRDGLLESPDRIEDPFHFFPLAAPDLVRQLGANPVETKFPLFFNAPEAQITEGNHLPPLPDRVRSSPLGITHHFKWRRSLARRLQRSIASQHNAQLEYRSYLDALGGESPVLPMTGSFDATRENCFARKLLRPVEASSLQAPSSQDIQVVVGPDGNAERFIELSGSEVSMTISQLPLVENVFYRSEQLGVSRGSSIKLLLHRWNAPLVVSTWLAARAPLEIYIEHADNEACIEARESARLLASLVRQFILPDPDSRNRWVDWLSLPAHQVSVTGRPNRHPPPTVSEEEAVPWEGIARWLSSQFPRNDRTSMLMRMDAERRRRQNNES